jgi:hypothetical protein
MLKAPVETRIAGDDPPLSLVDVLIELQAHLTSVASQYRHTFRAITSGERRYLDCPAATRADSEVLPPPREEPAATATRRREYR